MSTTSHALTKINFKNPKKIFFITMKSNTGLQPLPASVKDQMHQEECDEVDGENVDDVEQDPPRSF